VATQGERRAETRQRLLDAAAELFAERGIDASSVDAIAERAERTSGAIYDHFGGKPGLLVALLEGWVDDVAVAIGAELATATSLDERLATLWRNVSDPPTGDGRWIALEHELWSFAARNDEARDHLARRYRAAWEGVDEAVAGWEADLTDATGRGDRALRVGPAVIGLLLGLEMMRRVDPSAVTDEMALAALRGGVVSITTGVPTCPGPRTSSRSTSSTPRCRRA
jgi:AcrR family transcriptional regulator